MSKHRDLLEHDYREQTASLGGFYLPHRRVDWTGEILDPKTGELVKEESMTKQSFLAECDINNIIKAFSVTGQWNHINQLAAQATFADLPDPLDYQEAIHLARNAEAAFMALPAKTRARFENDPAQLLEFIQDPDNRDEAIELGFIDRPFVTEPPAATSPNAPPEASK